MDDILAVFKVVGGMIAIGLIARHFWLRDKIKVDTQIAHNQITEILKKKGAIENEKKTLDKLLDDYNNAVDKYRQSRKGDDN